jgi:acyl-CoA synthetase (AMP-forming)/AMP-acid ligase II
MTDTSSNKMPIKTLDQVLRIHNEGRPDKIAMRADDRTWTYAELFDESCRVAQAFLAEGLSPQDRVAFLDRNVPEYFSLLFGASMVNAVTLAVNWRLAAPEMEYILNHAEAKILLIGEEFLGHLKKMKLETVQRILVVGEDGQYSSYQDWFAEHDPVDPEIGCRDDETCYQLYTSGTTGLPKGVELTHRNLMAAMEVGAESWSIDEASVNMVAMPLFHIAGSGWGVGGFCQGAESILVRDMNPTEVIRLIEEYGVTNTLFVPAVLQMLCATPGVEKADFSSLRSIVYGASPISEQVLVASMKTFGCGFIQVYGLTETTGAITAMSEEDHDPGGPKAHLLRSAGKAWGDTKIRIVDEESTRDLPEGEVGEIWIWSSQNMKGYWRNPKATEESYPEGRDEKGIGWFRTGDAGYMKEDYLYIHDRVKDMILSGGENIYPAEIENVLMGHPAVADAAVIGVPSEKWGESVTAIIVDTEEASASDEEIVAYCRERLAHYKCPTAIDRTEALPRNPSGKILKTELREPYWKGHARRVN